MDKEKAIVAAKKYGWLIIPLSLVINFIAARFMNDTVGMQKDITSGAMQNYVPKGVFIFATPVILLLIYVYALSSKEKLTRGIVISIIIFIVNFLIIFSNLK